MHKNRPQKERFPFPFEAGFLLGFIPSCSLLSNFYFAASAFFILRSRWRHPMAMLFCREPDRILSEGCPKESAEVSVYRGGPGESFMALSTAEANCMRQKASRNSRGRQAPSPGVLRRNAFRKRRRERSRPGRLSGLRGEYPRVRRTIAAAG